MARAAASRIREAERGHMGARHLRNISDGALLHRRGPRRPQNMHDDGLQPQNVSPDEPRSAHHHVYIPDFDDFASGEDPFAARLYD